MASLMSILKQAGFRGNALKMAYSIAMAESGGRAGAHNGNAGTGDNSYGLFQINMLGAMGPDRRRRYGLKSNSDLYNALTNARIAYKMSNGGKNWMPWSTYKSGAYRRYYGGSYSANVSGGGKIPVGSTYNVGAANVSLDNSTLAEMYGLTYATIKANKSLKSLFGKAVAGGWTADRFTAALKNTSWWRTTSDSARKYFLLRTSDPATYKSKYTATAVRLAQMGVGVGLSNLLTKGNTPGHIDPLLARMVGYAMRDGWTDARLKNYMGQYVKVVGGVMGGDAGEAFDQLHQTAYLNGLTHSTNWYQSTVRSVVSGKSTMELQTAQMRKIAAGKYSAFSNQIMAGQNALDLAQPYISDVARVLELPETDVDLFNKHVATAMSAKPNGTGDGSQYPLWQFENDLRSDPLWKKTNNARESMFTTARQIARDFGMAY
jgi:hypothetical protein